MLAPVAPAAPAPSRCSGPAVRSCSQSLPCPAASSVERGRPGMGGGGVDYSSCGRAASSLRCQRLCVSQHRRDHSAVVGAAPEAPTWSHHPADEKACLSSNFKMLPCSSWRGSPRRAGSWPSSSSLVLVVCPHQQQLGAVPGELPGWLAGCLAGCLAPLAALAGWRPASPGPVTLTRHELRGGLDWTAPLGPGGGAPACLFSRLITAPPFCPAPPRCKQ